MKQIQFYLCPTCGNITLCTGNATVSCCGRPLAALTPQKATPENALQVEIIEEDWYITSHHPMTKTNYISFLAFATGGAVQLYKQYPEWEIHCRIPKRGHGKLFWYSTSQGFFYQLLQYSKRFAKKQFFGEKPATMFLNFRKKLPLHLIAMAIYFIQELHNISLIFSHF